MKKIISILLSLALSGCYPAGMYSSHEPQECKNVKYEEVVQNAKHANFGLKYHITTLVPENNLEKCTYRSPVTKAVMIKDGLARKIEMIDVGAKVSNWKRDHHPAGIIYDDEMAADCTYNPHRYRDWFCKGTNGKNYTLPNNNNKVTEGELITLAVKTIDCLKGKGSNVKIDSNEDITSCIQTPKGKLPRHNPLIPSDPGFRRGQGHFYKKMDYGFCYDARVHCRFSK
ncbi:hypothetical protein HOD05_04625 [Candidatus Woesearchaeota archaeon]|jgi:hypothetical protein|nr:hypothetical protein [Candidatus Woesearchaeota archaeon]MBT4150439.1 hypothetical protein [Candidatus Woesearchaeota archaeon]MBT4247486.1 hypothetical protein [Candidatus Woesearchaeota archaeon]MBT4434475.1 hypothetical protein [Candidatus Woesearchaeota archaeon]MBT7331671.1 hypothetical protein [Candidatus Woesearchaeota archaeon]